jgi:hypothetical protein
MYALRERRVHVTQEDFELAVAKVRLGLMLSCAVIIAKLIGIIIIIIILLLFYNIIIFMRLSWLIVFFVVLYYHHLHLCLYLALLLSPNPVCRALMPISMFSSALIPNPVYRALMPVAGDAEGQREEHVDQEVLHINVLYIAIVNPINHCNLRKTEKDFHRC